MATDGVPEVVRALRRLTAWLTLTAEQTEARVGAINDLVQGLTAATGLPRVMILGQVALAHDPDKDSDRPEDATILHAALIAPHGVGVVFWTPAQ